MIFKIDGPGLLHVRSRISSPSLTESVFLAWYDNEHIPEVVSTSGIQSAFRYIDVAKTSANGDKANPKPFFAFYPMKDLRFTQSDEFRTISVTGKELPGSGVVYDLAEFDVGYMAKKSVSEKKGKGGGTARFILTCGIRPDEDSIPSSQLEDFYSKQTEELAQCPGYSRTSMFDLRYARTNADSRKLKGLPASDEPSPEPSTWLAMHELDERPAEDVVEKIRKDAKQLGEVQGEVYVWELQKTHGEGKFFD
ncbi:hypothetical protein DE146DRAFT_622670 [Phaeosphaeria sp. MPI-PUGE-AT-0046c]|nr:hypothetical protein DE146DRAFT_622670 [Phaeosphaeria sp. MPI-PUGE-AT-0046c]